MGTQYDDIGEDYLQTKAVRWKQYAEPYALFTALGSLQGKRVIDVACGDGYFTRPLALMGAREVVGIDISEEMVKLARAKEQETHLGIRYEVADGGELAASIDSLGQFDVATAQWLLDYAVSRDHLRAMCRSLAAILKPGGRFVHMGSNFDSLFHYPENFAKDNATFTHSGPYGDGARVRWTIRYGEDNTVSAENTMWTPETITEELENAGFKSVEWPETLIGPVAYSVVDPFYWKEFEEHPWFAVTVATLV
ncbi:MAG: methyltransferase domain-containing protein [Verrucomicrobiota bacterium]